jgi:purine-binding chemotaxis protein CheW
MSVGPPRSASRPISSVHGPMSEHLQFVVFRLDEQRYGLPLEVVERIVRAAEMTPLPRAPAIVLGAIDVGGLVLPVLNAWRRFRLPEHEVSPADQFLIARTGGRTVVFVIDEAQGVIEVPAVEIVDVDEIVPGLDQIRGVVKLDDGLVLIHDLDKFLSLDEELALDQAMKQEKRNGA